MSKTFDDVVLEHKESLAKNLIGFDEGKRVRKLLLDVDANVSDYEYYFQAGQQSRQAEINALQKKYDKVLKAFYLVEKHRYELGKRIDDVLKYVGDDFEDFYEGELVKGVHEILKGDKND